MLGRRSTVLRLVLLGALALLLAVGGAATTSGGEIARASTQSSEPADGPTEVAALENATTDVFRNDDGSLTAEIHTGPVNMMGPDGWTDISTDLTASDDHGYAYEPTATPVAIDFASQIDVTRAVKVASDQTSVAFSLANADTTHPSVDGDTITYPDALPNTDLAFQARADGVKEEIVLDQAPAFDQAYRFPLVTVGLTPQLQPDGSIRFANASGKAVFEMPAPIMWDSNVDPHSGEAQQSSDISITLDTTGATPTLVLKPSASWLADSARQYPVFIDPSLTKVATTDTFVQTGITSSNATDTDIKVGTYDGGTDKARGLVKFDQSDFSGTTINSATLSMYENWSWSCTNATVNVYRVTSSWSSSVNWSNQPGIYTNAIDAIYDAKGYSGSCPAGRLTFDVSTPVQNMADGSVNNYGFELRANDETNNYGWKRFSSSETANDPKLIVNYNTTPAAPSNLAPADPSYVGDSTPALSGKFTDPDGGSGHLDFRVYRTSDDHLMISSTTCSCTQPSNAQSGNTSSWTVPASVLSDGAYYWQARANDGSLTSAWSSSRALTVDTVAPGTPTIASSSNPVDSAWYSTAAGVTATFSASDSGSGLAGYSWDLTQSATSTPDSTIDAAPSGASLSSPGIWYLSVRAKDNAGNWGPTARQPIQAGTPVALNASATLSWAATDQVRAAVFTGTQGQQVSAVASGLPVGASLNLVGPDGQVIAAADATNGNADIGNTALPATGSYGLVYTQLQVTDNGGDTTLPDPSAGQGVVSVYNVADPTPIQLTQGQTSTVSIDRPYRRPTLTFSASAGTHDILKVSGGDLVPVTASVVDPSGSPVGEVTSADEAAVQTDLMVGSAGTYTVTLTPQSSATGTVNASVRQVANNITQSLAAGTTSGPVSLSDSQDATLSTSVTTNRLMYSVTPTGLVGGRVMLVDTTTGEALDQYPISDDSQVILGPSATTAGDSYALVVDNAPGVSGSFNAAAFAVPDDSGGSVDPASPTTLTPALVPGQGLTMSFMGTAGELLNLHIGSWSSGAATISLTGDTGLLYGVDLPSSAPADVSLPPLPGAGSYTIDVSPTATGSGNASVRLEAITPPSTATMTATDDSASASIPAGSGSASVDVATGSNPGPLQVATSSANTTITVESSTGSVLDQETATPSAPATVPASVLPSSGSVTLSASTPGSGAGEVVVTQNDPADSVAALSNTGAAQIVNLSDSADAQTQQDASSTLVASGDATTMDVGSTSGAGTTITLSSGDQLQIAPEGSSTAGSLVAPGVVVYPTAGAAPETVFQTPTDGSAVLNVDNIIASAGTSTTISYAVTGEQTQVVDDPSSGGALIESSDQGDLLDASGATAVDASGATMPASIQVTDDQTIEVSVSPTSGAHYPVVVSFSLSEPTAQAPDSDSLDTSGSPDGVVLDGAADATAAESPSWMRSASTSCDLTSSSDGCQNRLLRRFQPVLYMNDDEIFAPISVTAYAHHGWVQKVDANSYGGVVWRSSAHDVTTPSGRGADYTSAAYLSQWSGSHHYYRVTTKGLCPLHYNLQHMWTCAGSANQYDSGSNPYSLLHSTYSRFWTVPSSDTWAYNSGTRYVLQYWYFYWGDDYFNGRLFQQHEADWEYAQVELGANLQPKMVDISQHNCGERLPWSAVARSSTYGPNHAQLFVARGSHSLWFRPGMKTLSSGRCSNYGVGSTLGAVFRNAYGNWYDRPPDSTSQAIRLGPGTAGSSVRRSQLLRVSYSHTPFLSYTGYWGGGEYAGVAGVKTLHLDWKGPANIGWKAGMLHPMDAVHGWEVRSAGNAL